jgi:hypothetical protein
MERKYYFSVWTSDTKIWEGIASTKYEAIERAYSLSCPKVDRSELVAKLKK